MRMLIIVICKGLRANVRTAVVVFFEHPWRCIWPSNKLTIRDCNWSCADLSISDCCNIGGKKAAKAVVVGELTNAFSHSEKKVFWLVL